MSNYIDKIFYINLDKRQDRRFQIEEELDAMDLKYERFPAFERTPGIVGCGLSHLAVLKLARDRGYKNVLIFEDDFEFTISKEEFESQLDALFTSGLSFDVCMLGYLIQRNEECEVPFLRRVREGQTASAYIVNQHYYTKLIELYEWAMPRLESTGQHWIYANDQIWKRLQKEDRWYHFVLPFGDQRLGFSDNSKTVVIYRSKVF